MPVRSLTSSILRWPDAESVTGAVRAWAKREAETRAGLSKLGYFGSYARGDAGVGSDLDVVAVVADSDLPFERRGVEWDLLELPVPAEILIYTAAEWDRLMAGGSRFAKTLEREAVWLEV